MCSFPDLTRNWPGQSRLFFFIMFLRFACYKFTWIKFILLSVQHAWNRRPPNIPKVCKEAWALMLCDIPQYIKIINTRVCCDPRYIHIHTHTQTHMECGQTGIFHLWQLPLAIGTLHPPLGLQNAFIPPFYYLCSIWMTTKLFSDHKSNTSRLF